MAERMSISKRGDRDRANARVTRVENGHLKRKERASRDKRMAELIGKGKFPYTPSIQSWISEKIGLPFTQVTEDQARGLLK